MSGSARSEVLEEQEKQKYQKASAEATRREILDDAELVAVEGVEIFRDEGEMCEES